MGSLGPLAPGLPRQGILRIVLVLLQKQDFELEAEVAGLLTALSRKRRRAPRRFFVFFSMYTIN